MDLPDIYRYLGCSARIYEYNGCYKKIDHPSVKRYTKEINPSKYIRIIETPKGNLTMDIDISPNSWAPIIKKKLITCEEDMKIAAWVEEHCNWEWDQDFYVKTLEKWGDIALPTMYLPRVNVQYLYVDTMTVEDAIYAIYDYPDTVNKYFKVLDESHERLIKVINSSPIDVINFGDNLHSGTLSPELFKKYVLPAYQKRNELLHKAGKFTHAHWDGDTKSLLPYAKECGLDGIEAITPKPQGDVTLEEIKKALGDDMFLIDGIAAILFDNTFTIKELENQTRKIIELFAPKLILGISDEISSTGIIDRILFVKGIVDEYNK